MRSIVHSLSLPWKAGPQWALFTNFGLDFQDAQVSRHCPALTPCCFLPPINLEYLKELAVSTGSLSSERRDSSLACSLESATFPQMGGGAEEEPGECLAGGGQDVKRDPKVWEGAKLHTSPLAFSVWGDLPQSTQTLRLNPALCLSSTQTKPALGDAPLLPPTMVTPAFTGPWEQAKYACDCLGFSCFFTLADRVWMLRTCFSFSSWHIYTLVLFCFIWPGGEGMCVGGDGVARTPFVLDWLWMPIYGS